MMNVTVVGGGNLGTLLSAKLSLNDDISTTLFTNNSLNFSSEIEVFDEENQTTFVSNKIAVTNDYAVALGNADVVLCTYPSFLREDFIKVASEYIKATALLGFVPGSGGVEFMTTDLLEKGVCIFGLSRVPYICRVKEYGKSVISKSKKQEIFVGAIPQKRTKHVADVIENLLGIKTTGLSSYLAVTLTPSNPILHTTRLYSIFKDYSKGFIYENVPLFYEDWTEFASKLLVDCDTELQEICKKLSHYNTLEIRDIPSILAHYQVVDSLELTKKIRSIPSFKKITTPMVKQSNGFEPDFSSRYFTEDFPYGLAIIKAIGLLIRSQTSTIDTILDWYSTLIEEHYFDGITLGKDVSKCGVPQKYGINHLEDFIAIYK